MSCSQLFVFILVTVLNAEAPAAQAGGGRWELKFAPVYGSSRSGLGKSMDFVDSDGNARDEVLAGAPTHAEFSLYDSNGLLLHEDGFGFRSGFSVLTLEDVNHDGYEEALISSPGNSAVRLIDLTRSGPSSVVYAVSSGMQNDEFGHTLAVVADLDRDGAKDFVVGAPSHAARRGCVYLYSGRNGALLEKWEGGQPTAQFGWSVAGLGDWNRDGFEEIAIGAPQHDVDGVADAGSVFVYSGKTGELLYPLPGFESGGRFAWSLASAGDVNADGVRDLLVGAPFADSAAPEAGSVYVYSGKDLALLYQYSGEHDQARWGWSVAGAGDVNQDGCDDFVIGADQARKDAQTALGEGAALVFSGASGTQMVRLEGSAPTDRFGSFVRGGGSVDKDRYPEIAVGAIGYGQPFPPADGAFYVYGIDPLLAPTATQGMSAQVGVSCQQPLAYRAKLPASAAHKPYRVLVSGAGIRPPTWIGGYEVPLAGDRHLQATIDGRIHTLPFMLHRASGYLDAQAQASFEVCASPSQLSGHAGESYFLVLVVGDSPQPTQIDSCSVVVRIDIL